MTGPGKYDDACTRARIDCKAQGVILIVFSGDLGHGFSAQLPPGLGLTVPAVLRDAADRIEADMRTALATQATDDPSSSP